MYTLDQQLKDIDIALEDYTYQKLINGDPYLCHTALNISEDFYNLITRAFREMEKISPKAYIKTIINPRYFVNYYSVNSKVTNYGIALWEFDDFESRLQFLNDLKEDIIENG